MNEKLKSLKEKITPFFKSVTIYGIILCSVTASFFIGIFYNQMINKDKISKASVVKSHDTMRPTGPLAWQRRVSSSAV